MPRQNFDSTQFHYSGFFFFAKVKEYLYSKIVQIASLDQPVLIKPEAHSLFWHNTAILSFETQIMKLQWGIIYSKFIHRKYPPCIHPLDSINIFGSAILFHFKIFMLHFVGFDFGKNLETLDALNRMTILHKGNCPRLGMDICKPIMYTHKIEKIPRGNTV